jgi:hypothetical protein
MNKEQHKNVPEQQKKPVSGTLKVVELPDTNLKAKKPSDDSEEGKAAAGKLVETLFPEGGKKTWLSEEMFVQADRLETLRSTKKKNLIAKINQKEKLLKERGGNDPSTEKSLQKLKEKLDNTEKDIAEKVAIFVAERGKRIEERSKAEYELVELLKQDGDDVGYRKKLREQFELGNAVEELNRIIGTASKEERTPHDEVFVLETRLSELEAERRLPTMAMYPEQEARSRLDGIRDALPGTDIEDLVKKDRKEWAMRREQRIEEGIPEEINRIQEKLARAKEVLVKIVDGKSAEVPPSPDDAPGSGSEPLSDAVRERFGALGIGEDDLCSVAGFESLSEGRRLFVAEMLRQSSVARVESRARERVESGWSLTKGFRLAMARKELAGSALEGGMAEYREDLVRLTEGIGMSGLDLAEKDGRFEIRFLSPADGTDADSSLRTNLESLGLETGFDEAATRLSEIPYAWSLDGATKAERADSAAALAAYESARAGMETRLEDDPSGRVLLRVAEHRIGLVRQMRSHPEVDGYLEKLRKEQKDNL